MTRVLIWLLVGGGIGAALGYFGQCTSGTCPLTANWKRGALFGAVLGLAFSLSSGVPATRSGGESVSTPNVKKLTEQEFEAEVLQASQPVVVDFYADWCGPCRRLAPMLDRAAGQFAGELKVVKVNVDQAPALARKYGIQGIPALKFFRAGSEVGGMVGLPSERDLENRLRQLAGGGGKSSMEPSTEAES